jgi:hypothetical protein
MMPDPSHGGGHPLQVGPAVADLPAGEQGRQDRHAAPLLPLDAAPGRPALPRQDGREADAAPGQATPTRRSTSSHTVCPRDDYEPGGLGGCTCRGRRATSCPTSKVELEEGGFRTWPFAIMRYMTASGEVYGRSPAWLAMSNIRTLNTMKRTTLAAAQKVADPPMLITRTACAGRLQPGPGRQQLRRPGLQRQAAVQPLHHRRPASRSPGDDGQGARGHRVRVLPGRLQGAGREPADDRHPGARADAGARHADGARWAAASSPRAWAR